MSRVVPLLSVLSTKSKISCEKLLHDRADNMTTLIFTPVPAAASDYSPHRLIKISRLVNNPEKLIKFKKINKIDGIADTKHGRFFFSQTALFEVSF
jgi:hypothetical protein